VAVALRCEAGRGRRYATRLRADARRLMAACGVAACELSVVIAGDDFIRALNRDFRGKDRATDVLSFSQLEEAEQAETAPPAARSRPAGRLPGGAQAGTLAPRPGTPLGDIVISAETAERQARRLGVAPEERMRTLLLHGMLHVLGYDHERSTAEARRMFARERELAAALAAADAIRAGARAVRKPSARNVRR
jgi:probable rRNA maturation factor